jgi:hypothetical protein
MRHGISNKRGFPRLNKRKEVKIMRKLTEQDFIDIIGFTFGDDEHTGYEVLKARRKANFEHYGIALVKGQFEDEHCTWEFRIDEIKGICMRWGHICYSLEEAEADYEVRV